MLTEKPLEILGRVQKLGFAVGICASREQLQLVATKLTPRSTTYVVRLAQPGVTDRWLVAATELARMVGLE